MYTRPHCVKYNAKIWGTWTLSVLRNSIKSYSWTFSRPNMNIIHALWIIKVCVLYVSMLTWIINCTIVQHSNTRLSLYNGSLKSINVDGMNSYDVLVICKILIWRISSFFTQVLALLAFVIVCLFMISEWFPLSDLLLWFYWIEHKMSRQLIGLVSVSVTTHKSW